ncbi:MAG: CoA pyrophosphatase [Myxococcota bacterium]
MDLAEIRRRLATYRPLCLPADGARRAAVLLPLRWMSDPLGGLELILTRRAEHLPTHAGQVALPGGNMMPRISTRKRLPREAGEELGIPAEHVEVLGRLDDMLTITGFHVVPVVGALRGQVILRPDPREVERAFTVPLAVLLDPAVWESRLHPWKGSAVRIWHVAFDGEDIWGATAAMLRRFVEVLWH